MKTTLLGILVLSLTLSATNMGIKTPVEKGRLSGKVTYKDSDPTGIKPDAGSIIYAISEADLKASNYQNIALVVGNFQVNKSEYSLSKYNTVDPVLISKAKENFEAAADFTSQYVAGFEQLPGIVKVSANETGNYSLHLKPGKYYILAVSGNVKGQNTAESNGSLDVGVAEVKAGGESALDVTFRTSGINLVMYQMSRTPIPGC